MRLDLGRQFDEGRAFSEWAKWPLAQRGDYSVSFPLMVKHVRLGFRPHGGRTAVQRVISIALNAAVGLRAD